MAFTLDESRKALTAGSESQKSGKTGDGYQSELAATFPVTVRTLCGVPC